MAWAGSLVTQAVVGQGDGHVGLAAAEGELQVVRLDKALVVVGLEPDHQLTEGNDFHIQHSLKDISWI